MSRRVATTGVLALAALAVAAAPVGGQIPHRMNYQVMLTDEAGQPIENQLVQLVFRIVDDPEGGATLWTEPQAATTNGIGVVTVILGSVIPIDVGFSGPLWLEVEVDGEIMLPRRELVSAPYAFAALESDRLAGHEPGDFAAADHDHDADYVNDGEPNAVTLDMIVPGIVESLDGVTNDGGDIDLVAGSNVTITPDDGANTITIAAGGGDDGDWAISGDDVYRLTGNVGVGISIPAAKLEVFGTAMIDGFEDDAVALSVGSPSWTGYPGTYLNDALMVGIYSFSDLAAEADMLALCAGTDSDTSSQFLECSRFLADFPVPFPTDREFRVDMDGGVYADGAFSSGGADFAEMIEVHPSAASVAPGDVVVIDAGHEQGVVRSSEPRSRLVAGVYSTRPGVVGSEREWDDVSLAEMPEKYGQIPVAVLGIVPCNVSAENGPIRRGDLLVTSGTPGHAMRDDDPKPGTILAKALEALETGIGTIRVLVTLQ